ncbi:MAG: hypothetical protein ACI3XR_07595 [Eubacteriales bacterium]
MGIKQKGVVCACLAVCMTLGVTLSGCSSGNSVVGYTTDQKNKYAITEGMYRYWMVSWKDYFVKNYSDVEDTAEYWQSEAVEGMTNEEYLTENIQTRIKYYYVAQPIFDELGLKETFKDTVQSNLNDMIEYYGSKSACNEALDALYGINLSTLKTIYTYEERYKAVNEYLFGDNGAFSATADELDEYYRNYYVRAKYILFLKNTKFRLDEDGKRVTDSSGYIVYDDLTDEEKEEVRETAVKITADLTSGITVEGYADPMDYYMQEYMSPYYDDILSSYPNGFYITADEYAVHTATVTDAVFNMDVGEVQMVENEDCYFIIKKYDLIDKGYMSTTDSAQFSGLLSYCNSAKLANYYSELSKNVQIDSAIADMYRLSQI